MDDIILRQRRRNPLKKKTPLSQQTQKTIISLMITLATLIAILSGIFLFSTGSNAQKGYILKQSQLQNTQLKEDLQDLNRKIMDASSVEKLQNSSPIKEMQEPETKTFVERKN